ERRAVCNSTRVFLTSAGCHAYQKLITGMATDANKQKWRLGPHIHSSTVPHPPVPPYSSLVASLVASSVSLPVFPPVQELDLEAVFLLSDATLELLGARCRRLRRLCVRMCSRLSASALQQLVADTDVRDLMVSGILDDAGTCDLVARVRSVRAECRMHW
ncbi:hypothetical protein Agub_g10072, partial [Astrephomene gubernaculifera]